MGRNIYQLVAIDENRKEHVIELKNKNENNKGHLSLIDYGTCWFKSEEQMRDYFESTKEDFPKNCKFKIKYAYNGEVKYLSCIYAESDLKDILRKKYVKKDGIFEKVNSPQIDYEQSVLAKQLFEDIEKLLTVEEFYEMLVLYERNRLGMSNVLNQKIQEALHKYTYLVNLPTLKEEEIKEKEDLKFSIIRELYQYKQYRTLYLFVKNYKNGELKKQMEEMEEKEYIKYRKSQEKKEGTWDFDEKFVVPQDVKYFYDKGGMDEVYQNYDSDELIGMGLRR